MFIGIVKRICPRGNIDLRRLQRVGLRPERYVATKKINTALASSLARANNGRTRLFRQWQLSPFLIIKEIREDRSPTSLIAAPLATCRT